MEINERLQSLTREKKIDQAEVARVLKINPSTISKWWNGSRTPGDKNLVVLADFFNCDIDWLATGRGIRREGYVKIFLESKEDTEDTYQKRTCRPHNANKSKNAYIPTKLSAMMEWIADQDDGRDYWAWVEMEFSEKFPDYRRWLKEKQDAEREKNSKTGTDY